MFVNIASFLRTVHGKSTTTTELINNVDLYRQASCDTSSSTFSKKGKEYICHISSTFRPMIFTNLDSIPHVKLYHKIPSSSNLISSWPHPMFSHISLYKTLFLNDIRFSADDFNTLRRSNDACVLYKSSSSQYSIGFIICIGHLLDNNEIYLLVNETKISSSADTLTIRDRTFRCTNIMQGTVLPDSKTIIKPSHIIQKLAFRPVYDKNANAFIFFQYPNLKECS